MFTGGARRGDLAQNGEVHPVRHLGRAAHFLQHRRAPLAVRTTMREYWYHCFCYLGI